MCYVAIYKTWSFSNIGKVSMMIVIVKSPRRAMQLAPNDFLDPTVLIGKLFPKNEKKWKKKDQLFIINPVTSQAL